MKAAWYERQGPAREVLVLGEMPDPEPGPGELRIRVAASGINPGDVKVKRFSLSEIAAADEWVEKPRGRARVVVEP